MKSRSRLILTGILLATILLTGCSSPFVKDGPLEFTELSLGKNSIGVPVIHVKVTNVSTRPVKAFTVKAKAWNAYGSALKAFGFGDYVYSGIYQTTIEPGETRTARWTLNGYDTAYKIEVTLDSAISDNNKTWTVGGIYVGDPRYTKTKTY